jgi:hypothetical protein
MNFKPKSEKELQQDNERLLLPVRKEPYPATVTKAVDKVSKSGNEMIEITLSVFADDGTSRFVTDYLMAAMMHKLFHFAEATGLMDAYSEGTICASDCEGREVFVKLGIDPAKGEFAAKNVVKDYISPKSEARHEAAKLPPIPPADDIDMSLAKADLPF